MPLVDRKRKPRFFWALLHTSSTCCSGLRSCDRSTPKSRTVEQRSKISSSKGHGVELTPPEHPVETFLEQHTVRQGFNLPEDFDVISK
ncbi:hypothetical protein J6590_075702 [Homalodisca vitripennis]|nr:hypothetical protein J6590_075702 [Homalodisca vitripennis]